MGYSYLKPVLAFLALLLIFYGGITRSHRRSGTNNLLDVPQRIFNRPKHSETLAHSEGSANRHSQIREVNTLASNLRINGVPVSLSSYDTPQSVSKALDEYRQKWRSLGREVIEQTFGDYESVSTFDFENQEYHCILACRDRSNHQTTVIPSVIRLTDTIHERRLKDIPTNPGSSGTFHLESNDYGFNSDSYMYVNDGSVGSNVNSYQAQMAGLGWRLLDAPPFGRTGSEQIFFFKKNTKECSVTFREIPNTGKTFVLMHVSDSRP